MTLDHRTAAITVNRLVPEDLVEIFGFLDRDPVLNVYLVALALRDALGKPHDEFWAVRRDTEMVGLLHLGHHSGAVLPVGEEPGALRRLADVAQGRLDSLPSRFQVIGPRTAVRAIVARIGEARLEPRLYRDQLYMALERGGLESFERLPELRRARKDDFDLLHQSGAMLRFEELEEDPRQVDPLAYTKRVEEECREGYTHLWRDQQGLCFRASVSALTPDAAQVSGVYTPPERRNRGLARRGLSELCSRLLEHSRSICLFVNDFNQPALALYRRLGFSVRAAWASAFYVPTSGARRGFP